MSRGGGAGNLARGPDGLETGLKGSINTEIVERAGGRNVAEAPGRYGLIQASPEQVIVADPDTIVTWGRMSDPAPAPAHDRFDDHA